MPAQARKYYYSHFRDEILNAQSCVLMNERHLKLFLCVYTSTLSTFLRAYIVKHMQLDNAATLLFKS